MSVRTRSSTHALQHAPLPQARQGRRAPRMSQQPEDAPSSGSESETRTSVDEAKASRRRSDTEEEAAALKEAQAVAAAADAAEEAEAAAAAQAVADEADRAEAAARAAAAAQAASQEQSLQPYNEPRRATPAAGPYAGAAASLRADQQQAASAAAIQALTASPAADEQQPALQRSGSALEVAAVKTYRLWVVVGVLMLAFMIWLVAWSLTNQG